MKIYALLIGLLCYTAASGQLKNRLILIGDAGEINTAQQAIIKQAASLVIPEKTHVIFLGDNIYPMGMDAPTAIDRTRTEEILQSQFQPMRSLGASVFFIPGNHDWNHMRPGGLEKVREQEAYIRAQADAQLQFLPANGCPDPVEIKLSEESVIIALDSEWFVFPYLRSSPDIHCACQQESQVIERVKELLTKHKDKQVYIAAHHPLRSYGVHAGYFSWKDHLFPLRMLNDKLYIPLPVLGSVFPILKNTVLQTAEDMGHPVYHRYIQDMRTAIQGHPHVTYISGHDHGLQLIQDPDFLQIVSGSGSKTTSLKKGKDVLFNYEKQGFVILDEMMDRSTEISYYTFQDNQVAIAYKYLQVYGEKPQTLLSN